VKIEYINSVFENEHQTKLLSPMNQVGKSMYCRLLVTLLWCILDSWLYFNWK